MCLAKRNDPPTLNQYCVIYEQGILVRVGIRARVPDIYRGGGLDHNSQLYIYPISRSQVSPDARSQSKVIICHIHTAIFLHAMNNKNII